MPPARSGRTPTLPNRHGDEEAALTGSLVESNTAQAAGRMIAHTWGLEVLLDVSGLRPGTRYEMAFIAADGRRVPAGGFIGTDGLMRCRNNGALLRSETVRFVVSDPDGAEPLSAETI